MKGFLKFLWGILDGHTNRAWPSWLILKNCHNGPNVFIWSAMKVLFCDFIQIYLRRRPSAYPSGYKWRNWIVSKSLTGIKKSFCLLGFLLIPKIPDFKCDFKIRCHYCVMNYVQLTSFRTCCISLALHISSTVCILGQ